MSPRRYRRRTGGSVARDGADDALGGHLAHHVVAGVGDVEIPRRIHRHRLRRNELRALIAGPPSPRVAEDAVAADRGDGSVRRLCGCACSANRRYRGCPMNPRRRPSAGGSSRLVAGPPSPAKSEHAIADDGVDVAVRIMTFRMRPSSGSAMYTFPLESTATANGSIRPALVASAAIARIADRPIARDGVDVAVGGDLADGGVRGVGDVDVAGGIHSHVFAGCATSAIDRGPPSPRKPGRLSPAMVLMMPSVVTLRMSCRRCRRCTRCRSHPPPRRPASAGWPGWPGPPSPMTPAVLPICPLPAKVLMMPFESSPCGRGCCSNRRYRHCRAESTAIPCGALNCALTAGPPSPEKPGRELPATSDSVAAGHLEDRVAAAEKYMLPAESTATRRGWPIEVAVSRGGRGAAARRRRRWKWYTAAPGAGAPPRAQSSAKNAASLTAAPKFQHE